MVSRVINGRHQLTPDEQKEWAEALGQKPEELFPPEGLAQAAGSEVDRRVTLYCCKHPDVNREKAAKLILQADPELAKEYLQVR